MYKKLSKSVLATLPNGSFLLYNSTLAGVILGMLDTIENEKKFICLAVVKDLRKQWNITMYDRYCILSTEEAMLWKLENS